MASRVLVALLLALFCGGVLALHLDDENEMDRWVLSICDEDFNTAYFAYSGNKCFYGACDGSDRLITFNLPAHGCLMDHLTYLNFAFLETAYFNPTDETDSAELQYSTVDNVKNLYFIGTSSRLIFQFHQNTELDMSVFEPFVQLTNLYFEYTAYTTFSVSSPPAAFHYYNGYLGQGAVLAIRHNPYLTTISGFADFANAFSEGEEGPQNNYDAGYPMPLLDISQNGNLVGFINSLGLGLVGGAFRLRVDVSYTKVSNLLTRYYNFVSMNYANTMVGSLPSTFKCENNFNAYCHLSLANNNISSTLSSFTYTGAFLSVNLANNKLIGTIPSSWYNNDFVSMDFRNNTLSGTLPHFTVQFVEANVGPGQYSQRPEVTFAFAQKTGAGFCPISEYPFDYSGSAFSTDPRKYRDYSSTEASTCTACRGTSPVSNSPICSTYGTCVTNTTNGVGYSCFCDVNHIGQWCQSSSFCALNPGYCVHGTCTRTNPYADNFACVCDSGYTGTTCNTVSNGCDPGPCQNGGTCTPGSGSSYTCACTAGYTGTNCTTDVNECTAGTPCQNGGTCTNTVGSYTCACTAGYSGATCTTDVNECTAGTPCSNGGTCMNTVGSFTCACTSAWTGATCATDVNECSTSNGGCLNGATCNNFPGTFNCTCAPGWSGTTCNTDINECSTSNGGCLNGATCVNTAGSFTCTCTAGYTGSLCATDVNECTAGTPCSNGGTCTNTVGSFTCACTSAWTGATCTTDVNECSTSNGGCLNGATCNNYPGTFNCSCTAGYTGTLCNTDVNECTAGTPCSHGGVCTNTVGSFTCNCAGTGYTGATCTTDVNECSTSNGGCLNGATCVNTAGSFTCTCTAAYTGSLCQTDVNECLTSNGGCLNGATCVNTVGSRTCTCTTAYVGPTCAVPRVMDYDQESHLTDCVTYNCQNADFRSYYFALVDKCEFAVCDGSGNIIWLDFAGYGCFMAEDSCPLMYYPFLTKISLDPDAAVGGGTFQDACGLFDGVLQEVNYQGISSRYILSNTPAYTANEELASCSGLKKISFTYTALTSFTFQLSSNLQVAYTYTTPTSTPVFTLENNPSLTTIANLGHFLETFTSTSYGYPFPTISIRYNSVLTTLGGSFSFAGSSTLITSILDLSHNGFTTFPSNTWQRNIFSLDLSYNSIGSIPTTLGCVSSTYNYCHLVVSNNNIAGTLPAATALTPGLSVDLNHNLFVGSIPTSWYASGVRIGSIDLSSNRLSGPLPNITFAGNANYSIPITTFYRNRVAGFYQSTGAGFCPVGTYPIAISPSFTTFGSDDHLSYGSCTPCAGTSPVSNSPICSTYGTCVTNSTNTKGFQCNCDVDHAGEWCQSASFCATNTSYCGTHGTCVRVTPGFDIFACSCSSGYSGTTCSTANNGCIPTSPCQNGGVCIAGSGLSYTCNCTGTGYTGTNCTTDVNECSTSNGGCLNGATCVNTAGSFTCTCASGWSGTLCDTPMINSGERTRLVTAINATCDSAYRILFPTLGANPCLYPGIACTTSGFVISLDFPAMPCLMSSLNTDFQVFTSLENLVVNPLDATGFSLLSSLEFLRRLELRGNATRNIFQTNTTLVDFPSIYFGLTTLNVLKISYSRITVFYPTVPPSFMNQHRIFQDGYQGPSELVVTNNPLLTDIPFLRNALDLFSIADPDVQNYIDVFPLPRLDFSHNPITTDLSAITLASPEYAVWATLDLSYTNVSTFPSWQQYIQRLDLSHTLITTVPSSVLCDSFVMGYCVFNMASNNIKGAVPVPSIDTIGFIALDLKNNRLYGSVPTEWGRLPVVSLDLRNNTLSGPLPPMTFAGEDQFGVSPYGGYNGRTAGFYQSPGAGLCPVYDYPISLTPTFPDDPTSYTDYPLYAAEAPCTPCHGVSPLANATICNGVGTCTASPSNVLGYNCSCGRNYIGRWCEAPSICSTNSSYCTSNGACTRSPNGTDVFYCNCSAGYQGSRCETVINYCASFPCSNGGTCTSVFATGFTCACVSGWTGTQCQTDVNECLTSPCQNGGTCTNTMGSYTCNCTFGHNGQNCENDVNFCVSNPCQHGGSCTSEPGVGFTCTCVGTWTGTICTVPSDTDAGERNRLAALVNATCDTNFRLLYASYGAAPCGQPGIDCTETGFIEGLDFPLMPCAMAHMNYNFSSFVSLAKLTVNPLDLLGYSNLTGNSVLTHLNLRGNATRLVGSGNLRGISTYNLNLPSLLQYSIEYSSLTSFTLGTSLPNTIIPHHDPYDRALQAAVIIRHNPSLTNITDLASFMKTQGERDDYSTEAQQVLFDFSYNPISTNLNTQWPVTVPSIPYTPGLFNFPRWVLSHTNISALPTFHHYFNYLDLSYSNVRTKPTYLGCAHPIMCVLYLQGNSLTGTLPPVHQDLGNGISIDLSHNRLVGTIQDEFPEVIVSVDLSFNYLSGPYLEGIYVKGFDDIGHRVFFLSERRTALVQTNGAGLCPVDQYPQIVQTPDENDDPNFYTDYPLYLSSNQCFSPCGPDGPIVPFSVICSSVGECRESGATGYGYACRCGNNYQGKWCQDPSPCTTNATYCAPNGTCVRSPASPTVDNFVCQCAFGYEGTRCQSQINYCLSGPCQHGGTCSPVFGTYNCSCPANFTGFSCETDVNECAVNNGGCVNGTCVNTVGSFYCNCSTGYTGANCSTLINYCANPSNPCQNNGNCTSIPTVGYTCSCPYGYSGTNCTTVQNFCSPNACQNGGTCNTFPGVGYNCTCPSNWTGTNCTTDRNECLTSNGGCLNGATCNNYPGSFNCTCTYGYSGPLCATVQNFCSPNACQNGATCNTFPGVGYNCTCAFGYSGTNCSIVQNFCAGSPCQNGGTCTNNPGVNYTCACRFGYSGPSCATVRNFCSPNPCQNGATCNTFPGVGYNCSCALGYNGTNCSDIITSCSPGLCQNGGTCNNLPGTFNCTCAPFYVGSFCQNIQVNSGDNSSFIAIYGSVCTASSYNGIFGSNPCLNAGVTCAAGGYIKALDFPKMPCFMANLSASWGLLTQLEGLVMNPLSAIGFTTLGGAAGTLKRIDFKGTSSRLIFQTNQNLVNVETWQDYDMLNSFSFIYTNLTSIDISLPYTYRDNHSPSTPSSLVVSNNPVLTSLVGFLGFINMVTTAYTAVETYVEPYPKADFSDNPNLVAPADFNDYYDDPNQIAVDIDFSNTKIGTIPTWQKYAYRLDLSSTLVGTLPTSFICAPGQTPYCHLALSNNNILGALSDIDFANSNPMSLSLKNNRLYGTMPESFGNLPWISLDLRNNTLSGELRSMIFLGDDELGLFFPNLKERIAGFYQKTGAGFCPVYEYPSAFAPQFDNAANGYSDWFMYDTGFPCNVCQGSSTSVSNSPICLGVGTCVEGTGSFIGYSCACSNITEGTWCQDASPCAQGPSFCSFHGQCQRHQASYINDEVYCQCNADWNSTDCSTPMSCRVSPCLHSGNCTHMSQSPGYPLDDYCVCTRDYYGTFCDLPSLCLTRPCGSKGTCTRNATLGNNVYCACQYGYEGPTCETETNFCANPTNPCQNGATCTSTTEVGYTCNCTGTGFSGVNCSVDVNECLTSNGGCLNGATCNNFPGTFNCSCPVGYSGPRCATYVCAVNPCLNNGTCNPAPGLNNYTCTCPTFYNGTNCSTFNDPCAPNPCTHGGTCARNYTTASFTCTCAAHYIGATCQLYDSCSSSPCTHGGICNNTGPNSGDFSCACPSNWEGPTCASDVNECALDYGVGPNGPCMNGGSCLNSIGNYSCACPLSYSGRNCQTHAACLINPCLHGGTCVTNAPNATTEYNCTCPADWTGTNCTVFVDGCVGSPCLHGGTCVTHLGQPNCTCTPQWTGSLCQTDVNECTTLSPACFHGGNCTNTVGNFTCACNLGYSGHRCNTTVCSDNPCQRGGVCNVTVTGNFTCDCPWAFPGRLCEQSRGVMIATGTMVMLGVPFAMVVAFLVATLLI